MNTRRIAVITAGLGEPSSTRMLADALARGTAEILAERDIATEINVIDLRRHAQDILSALLTGAQSPELRAVMATLAEADGVVAVTPIFSTSYSGLFKMFLDIVDRDVLTGIPVLLGATAGTPRHSLAIDYAIRPIFTYLHADPLPTAVFAATADWGSEADTVATLPSRIARGAGELAARLLGSAPVRAARAPEVQAPAEVPGNAAFDGGFVPLGELLAR
ncbi:CE1759 family FMN reductase [Mycetocola spongiae]|uniref:CE1759 family FMN reductase n=1 Tax=Mycetocola spongiae TaxID=2859226 RepID=UPI001CF224D7|nr:CE1759 family FMN reductase [Mycetocola spongiae]UCR90055.1 NAD(P)H-dependent oxidoreductase [Mycetocola spongiae]